MDLAMGYRLNWLGSVHRHRCPSVPSLVFPLRYSLKQSTRRTSKSRRIHCIHIGWTMIHPPRTRMACRLKKRRFCSLTSVFYQSLVYDGFVARPSHPRAPDYRKVTPFGTEVLPQPPDMKNPSLRCVQSLVVGIIRDKAQWYFGSTERTRQSHWRLEQESTVQKASIRLIDDVQLCRTDLPMR